MRMKLSRLTIVLVAFVAAACPYDRLSRAVGIALGGGGGGSSGPNVLLILQQPLTGTAGQILTPAILVGAADTLRRAGTGFTGTIPMAPPTHPAGGDLTGTRSVAGPRGTAPLPAQVT